MKLNVALCQTRNIFKKSDYLPTQTENEKNQGQSAVHLPPIIKAVAFQNLLRSICKAVIVKLQSKLIL